MPARRYENELAVAYANHVGGSYNDGTFCGGSVVIRADGHVLAAAGSDAPDLLVADVTRDDVSAARAGVDYLRDRRPETYQNLLEPTVPLSQGVRT